MADNDPNIQKIRRVPVGNVVVYHGRNGAMRQGRTEFPALVLKQHPDDGSLDLIVEFEAEDRIWEQRVRQRQSDGEGHCWELVEPPDVAVGEPSKITMERLAQRIIDLDKAMYGDFNPPGKSMIEFLDDFDKRLQKLEAMLSR